LAGLVIAAKAEQKVIGISVMKNNIALGAEIDALLPGDKQNHFQLLHQFHFGGYAKKTPQLLQFMNDWYHQTSIPTDFVYTGKLFFATDQLIKQNFFENNSKILIIHSGGLQGNASLPKGTLIY
jgi:1-aminocyclopropane-1-carboxylate deaminase